MTNIVSIEEQRKEIALLKELAQNAVKSGAYPLNESQIFNLMLSARDFGVSPMKAINGGFNVINGKISMSTSLMADRIRKDGHSIKIVEWTDQKCVIIGQRRDNGDSVKFEFTMKDATLAGLTNSPTWKKYPKAMLYNRAMSQLARVLFPDVVGSCYSEEEIEEINKSSFPKQSVQQIEPVKNEEIYEEIEPETIEPDMTIGQAIQIIMENVAVASSDKLKEYIEYILKHYQVSLSDCVSKWMADKDRFVAMYSRWLDKKRAID